MWQTLALPVLRLTVQRQEGALIARILPKAAFWSSSCPSLSSADVLDRVLCLLSLAVKLALSCRPWPPGSGSMESGGSVSRRSQGFTLPPESTWRSKGVLGRPDLVLQDPLELGG